MQTAAFPITVHEGEPRVLDVHLAAQLGFARPTEIRRIIARHRQNLSKISVLATVTQTPGSVGGRPSIGFYLNKKQAIFITAKSETPKAIEVTLAIIERFDAYERAAAVPLPAMDPSHALSVVREARETFGIPAARRAWIALGLPAGRDMLATAERLRCLTNANVLTTGFDAPGTDLIALLRPTKSVGLYVQMVGRGTRGQRRDAHGGLSR